MSEEKAKCMRRAVLAVSLFSKTCHYSDAYHGGQNLVQIYETTRRRHSGRNETSKWGSSWFKKTGMAVSST